ncbi:hypothetical protein KSC_089850 [Ktedonobacter sp. SOSP1-52]|uniref:VOC family protein n=1 Tax=Ktedonobacter sp. SOSP1-52 TaxID=2778366 RepID=UPI001916940B|nr:VOC family protein [Ktedonobacter sp. SOSP1-52]GHO70093.1 hypothetical protein KSC_089850 [Ktedonobacter sp. SOSP1-52]
MYFASGKSVTNRSIPASTVIPVLAYEDVLQAAEWLCKTFGFKERLLIGHHRVQLTVGDAAVIVNEGKPEVPSRAENHSVLIRVEDVDRHYELTRERGAHILQPPTTYPYGERQYTVEDPGGHRWTFSQSVADADPEEWGGTWPSTEKNSKEGF